MDLRAKVRLLASAARYDASCASSGVERDGDGRSLGSSESVGICHSYTPDGRCVSLLKILLTNYCLFDCAYCVNRRSSNVKRAKFSVDEVVTLTVEFYKRNYIEGLFLSSGIIRDSDHTMEQLVLVARSLRTEHAFRGYIHLKTIPDASPELLDEAGRYADRLSINIELPTERGLAQLAPEKRVSGIRRTMGELRWRIDESEDARKAVSRDSAQRGSAKSPRFAPAGQSTQMIVGADGASDATILGSSARLYSSYGLKRVYYSAFSPIPDSSRNLPLIKPPLMREHRLYQADWLYRFYGFSVEEIAAIGDGGMLDLELDPKLAWALANRDRFPVDVNTADREALLRVPGFGTKTVNGLLSARRHRRVRLEDLARLGVSLKKVRSFIVAEGWSPHKSLDRSDLRAVFAPPAEQLSLF